MPSFSRSRRHSPRRVMPGRPLPDIPTLDVEEQVFDLLRTDADWRTKHLHFYLSDDHQPQSGARGLTLDKLDKSDPYAHGFAFAVEGNYKWGFGMDFETDNAEGNADFVNLFDHTTDGGSGADVIRASLGEDSTLGPLATKFAIGQRGGSPRGNAEGLLIACGDTSTSLGGVRINYWASGVARFALALVNAHATNNNCLVNFNDQFYLGTDISGTGAQTFHLWDQVAAALRMTVDSSGRFKIGTGNPTALLHLGAGVAAASGAPLKLTSGTNLTSPEAGAIEYNGTFLFFTPASARRSLVYTVQPTSAEDGMFVRWNNGSSVWEHDLIDLSAIAFSPTTVTGDTTLTSSHGYVRVDASGGAVTITLPAVASVPTGRAYIVKKVDSSANAVTIDPDGAETIDGSSAAATTVPQTSFWAINNGTGWDIN